MLPGVHCGRIWSHWQCLQSFSFQSAHGASASSRSGFQVDQTMAKKKNSNDKMSRNDYEKELRDLQVELCTLQEWVKQEGLRVIVIFEGRDAAGKGGLIKAITER